MLYFIPTPIGNLEDISLRAIKILRECEIAICEDTRVCKSLINLLNERFDASINISKFIPLHTHNENDFFVNLSDNFFSKNVAYMSDAGMPGISDPGFFLAREAVAAGITVNCLPGATACIPAVVSSGMPCDRFCFEGFIPQKKGRKTYLESLKDEQRTMVFYESPYRLVKTLTQFSEVLGPERQVCVCREISKLHEENVRGTLQEVVKHFEQTAPRGEIVIVLAGTSSKKDKKSKGEKL